MITHVCSYCQKELGKVEEKSTSEEQISHGVCPDCFAKMMAGEGQPIEDFLDTLPGPIFVVDKNASMIGANSKALKCIPKDMDKIEGKLNGEVFECKYAQLPGGCGQTVHCKSCTIRNTVTQTFETGDNCYQVPAYIDLGDVTGDRTIKYLISTEKVGEVILLRIDDVQDSA